MRHRDEALGVEEAVSERKVTGDICWVFCVLRWYLALYLSRVTATAQQCTLPLVTAG
jgi:hypothetical protein